MPPHFVTLFPVCFHARTQNTSPVKREILGVCWVPVIQWTFEWLYSKNIRIFDASPLKDLAIFAELNKRNQPTTHKPVWIVQSIVVLLWFVVPCCRTKNSNPGNFKFMTRKPIWIVQSIVVVCGPLLVVGLANFYSPGSQPRCPEGHLVRHYYGARLKQIDEG